MTKIKGVKLYYSIAWDAMICPRCDNIYGMNKKFMPKICGECYMRDRLKMKEDKDAK